MHDSLASNCPNCDTDLGSGRFCASCGEQRFDHHSLSLKHFLEHAIEAFTHFDGAIFRTLKALVAHPGKLTADYVRGCRKPYLAPVQLFLLMNLLNFAITAWNGWNTFATDLHTHITWTKHQTIARGMVKQKLAERNMKFEEYAPVFNAKSRTQAKSLVILMVPMFALALAALRIFQGRYFAEHLTFSVHFYAFLLLYISVATSLTNYIVTWLKNAGRTVTPQGLDSVISWIAAAVLVWYLSAAMLATGTASWWRAVLKGVFLTGATMFVLQLYRFVLFLIGFYTT
ncbi:MAG: DUF3667 domain-containing protein [Bryobacterales bacterium]|nr:DUF3667 domain-containing protein [Bryobacterales bacterium]